MRKLGLAMVLVISLACTATVFAQSFPTPKEGDWIAKDFRFHTGEVMPELRVHYTTVGAPSGEPVVILHGTTGSGAGMLTPIFAGELFGPGQPLDASKILHHPARRDGSREDRETFRWPCGPNFPSMTMTTWSVRSTGS